MLYLRLCIGVIFILLCTKIGKNKGDKYKNSVLFYESALSFCNNFKSDLLYKKSNLNDFLNFEYTSVDFKNILENYITNQEISFYPEFLTANERLEFDNFFLSLGKTDSLSQIEVINAYKDKFHLKLEDKRVQYKKYYTLTSKLGFIVGLGIMIMVL